ncbi:MAG: tetratricopeptide repeat protein [Planctomycetes bacterium]|nr:tetratricopeptide repeat protein [Planctomycetota bacterium]
MIATEQARFLDIAVAKGHLAGETASKAKAILDDPSRRKPLPFALMEQGLLSGDAVDEVLSEMIQRVDSLVAEGDKMVRMDAVTRAIFHYDEALESCPSDERPRWKKVAALLERRRFDDAVAELSQLLEITADRAGALRKRGTVHSRAGRLPDAIADLEASVAIEPGDGRAHLELGLCFHSQREIDRAIACYERAIAAQPDLVEAYNNLAIALIRAKRPEEAVKAWDRALHIDRSRRTILHNVQALLKKMGRPPGKP